MWTVVVRDPQGKEVKRLPLNTRLVIGRTPQCEILLESAQVSRQHARIELFKDKPVFVDLGSANGSLLNGQAVTKPTLVDERHRIEIAGYKISFVKSHLPEDNPADRTIIASAASFAAATAARPPTRPAVAATTDLPAPSVDDLVPMRPSASVAMPSKPAATPEIKVPEIKVPEQHSGAPRKEVNWNSATDVFEQQLQGIRAHREEIQRGSTTRLQQLEADWAETIVSIRQLQAKLHGNPKVMQFAVSRDAKEVSIKLADPGEKRGYRYFLLSRHHPEGQYPALDAVWLREFGVDDTHYKEPKKAMQELVQRIAGTLA